MDNHRKTIHKLIYDLEVSGHFDELVKYAITGASQIEKALIYINLVEIFASYLGIEFDEKIRKEELEIGFNRWKKYKEHLLKISSNLSENNSENISGWDEIAEKIIIYKDYRNDFVHNLLIDKDERRIRSPQEIKHIVFTTGELAEEIYNLIIGAREYLEMEK